MTIAGAHLGVSGNVVANQRAPRELAAIGGAAEWLNSPRLTPSSLAGKVVLVDFWTYTCINWLRTLPYVRAWAQKYRANGSSWSECTHPSSCSNGTSTTSDVRCAG